MPAKSETIRRLDQLLFARGLCESREQAKRLIMAGRVRHFGQVARKASDPAANDDEVEIVEGEKYVSRGGHKLEHALDHFRIDPNGITAIDLGASTGGFTDCLLQRGAHHVYAIDVGKGQLAWALRRNHRVTVMEKTNARYLSHDRMPPKFKNAQLITIDCSFISLQKIIPPAIPLAAQGANFIALVKPQFEAGKAEANKGAGVITDPSVHQRVLDELKEFVDEQPAISWRDFTPSPLKGPAGNTEFLAWIEKTT
ncbi:MAG: TlyA family rRNA (cytidine-2'-O)-methyltransferase [Verrucomicrobiales bacterium]|nr:TlyA family rRNA (cytidine-2'-O)-methyltransferase [Verrucomicrobiales bacterium]